MPTATEPPVRDAPTSSPGRTTQQRRPCTQSIGARPPGKSSIMTTATSLDPKAPFKDQAKRLRASLAGRGVEVSHSEALELVARQHGARDWNTLAAQPPDPGGSAFGPVIPVLRIFDVAKAREFYSGFLGFAIDWERTFDDHAPVYLQASRRRRRAAPQRAPRRRQPGSHRPHRRGGRDGSAPGAARARLRLRPARRRERAVGARGQRARPVRQPAGLPPAHLGRGDRGGRHRGGPDRARVRRRVPARARLRGCSPRTSRSGGTPPTHRPVSPR